MSVHLDRVTTNKNQTKAVFSMRFVLSNSAKTSKSTNESISNNDCISVKSVNLVTNDHLVTNEQPVTCQSLTQSYQLYEMFPQYNSKVAFPATSGPNLITLLQQIYFQSFIIHFRFTSGSCYFCERFRNYPNLSENERQGFNT